MTARPRSASIAIVRVALSASILALVAAAGCASSGPASPSDAGAPASPIDAGPADLCAPDAGPADPSTVRVVGSCLRASSGPTSTCLEWHRARDYDPNPGIAKCPAPGVWSPDACPRASPGGACAIAIDARDVCPVVVWTYTYANAGDLDAGVAELAAARRACEAVTSDAWLAF